MNWPQKWLVKIENQFTFLQYLLTVHHLYYDSQIVLDFTDNG